MRRWRRLAALTALFVVAAIVGAVQFALPSYAAPTPRLTIGNGSGSCPGGYVCLWTLNNYTGSGYAFYNSETDYLTLPAPFNNIQDNSWSFYNNGNTYDIKFYRANNYGQDAFVVCKQSGIEVLPANSSLPVPGNPNGAETEPGRGWRDTVSSHSFGTWC